MPGPLPIQIGRNTFAAGHQRLVVSSAAVGLTVPSDKVVQVYCRLSAGPIFYTLDGTTPSATNGIEVIDGESFVLNLHEALKFQAIRNAVDGVLNVVYYGT